MVRGERFHRIVVVTSILLILLTACSGCVHLTSAYISNTYLTDGWYENLALRNTGSQLLGLEKWGSVTYEIKGKYPASVTITTIKTILLKDIQELNQNVQHLIEDTFQHSITLSTNTTGERTLFKNHKTMYVCYDGRDMVKDENVKIIGEVWNCGTSGTSLICIGIAYVTNKEYPELENRTNWEKIVSDPQGTIEHAFGEDGLLYHVTCH
jgi:hypothetical protein